MRFADLSPAAREKVAAYRYDRIIEKHEGPELWSSLLRYADLEFLAVDGAAVLLPRDKEHLPNMTVLRVIWSEDRRSMTLFLKDTTTCDDPQWEKFYAGFIAVCDRVPDEDFYLAIVYHEWFIIEPPQFA